MTLPQLRKRIDAVDREILSLLNRRATLAQRVGRIKERLGRPIFDGRREQEVLRRLARLNAGPLPPGAIGKIFREVLRASRALERSKAAKKE
ncbi:MAG: chorismate mutase [Candidatus Omnitrophica bacterium]|nr:chorismate mutase [Candidatus Omnitrophota bacterium]